MWYFRNLLFYKSVVFSNLLLLGSTPICCHQVVVAFFKIFLKVVSLLLQGDPPLHPPAAPQGAGLSARRLRIIRTHQNVEVYGRSEDEAQRKCILQAEKHYAWAKKTLRRTFVSLGKTVFSPFGRKKQPFFLRKQKFASEFFCPWHNVSSQKEHIFQSCPAKQ